MGLDVGEQFSHARHGYIDACDAGERGTRERGDVTGVLVGENRFELVIQKICFCSAIGVENSPSFRRCHTTVVVSGVFDEFPEWFGVVLIKGRNYDLIKGRNYDIVNVVGSGIS